MRVRMRMPAKRLGPGGCQAAMRGTSTTNPQKPKTTEGMPAKQFNHAPVPPRQEWAEHKNDKRLLTKCRVELPRRIEPPAAKMVPDIMG